MDRSFGKTFEKDSKEWVNIPRDNIHEVDSFSCMKKFWAFVDKEYKQIDEALVKEEGSMQIIEEEIMMGVINLEYTKFNVFYCKAILSPFLT